MSDRTLPGRQWPPGAWRAYRRQIRPAGQYGIIKSGGYRTPVSPGPGRLRGTPRAGLKGPD
eukprot:760674-Hanusia_phi.AAC.2